MAVTTSARASSSAALTSRPTAHCTGEVKSLQSTVGTRRARRDTRSSAWAYADRLDDDTASPFIGAHALAMAAVAPHETGTSAMDAPTEAPGAPTPDQPAADVPALHLAAQHGDLAQIQALLDEGASPNLRDASEITALVRRPAGWTCS